MRVGTSAPAVWVMCGLALSAGPTWAQELGMGFGFESGPRASFTIHCEDQSSMSLPGIRGNYFSSSRLVQRIHPYAVGATSGCLSHTDWGLLTETRRGAEWMAATLARIIDPPTSESRDPAEIADLEKLQRAILWLPAPGTAATPEQAKGLRSVGRWGGYDEEACRALALKEPVTRATSMALILTVSLRVHPRPDAPADLAEADELLAGPLKHMESVPADLRPSVLWYASHIAFLRGRKEEARKQGAKFLDAARAAGLCGSQAAADHWGSVFTNPPFLESPPEKRY